VEIQQALSALLPFASVTSLFERKKKKKGKWSLFLFFDDAV